MNMIEVKHLTKRYGEVLAVDDISFEVPKNSILGFVGKNGAGKTTTIRCMLDFLKADQGEIWIDGLRADKDSAKIKSFLSYMPSDTSFYDKATSLNIFQLVCQLSHSDLEKAKAYSHYFELDLHKPFKELSLGNKKKVSIIQALLKNAKVLVLDEPTNGLDPLMQIKFFKLLQELREKGLTIFLSSHNLSEIQKYCDRVLILKDGKIIDDLEMRDLKETTKQIVTYRTIDNQEVSYEYEGDINELIQQLAKLSLTQLEIRNQSVEDEFIKYYKE